MADTDNISWSFRGSIVKPHRVFREEGRNGTPPKGIANLESGIDWLGKHDYILGGLSGVVTYLPGVHGIDGSYVLVELAGSYAVMDEDGILPEFEGFPKRTRECFLDLYNVIMEAVKDE